MISKILIGGSYSSAFSVFFIYSRLGRCMFLCVGGGKVSNSDEDVIHMSQIIRTGASPSNAFYCHTQDTPFRQGLTGDKQSRMVTWNNIIAYPLKMIVNFTYWLSKHWYYIAQLTRAVEYTNYSSAKGQDFPNECPG